MGTRKQRGKKGGGGYQAVRGVLRRKQTSTNVGTRK